MKEKIFDFPLDEEEQDIAQAIIQDALKTVPNISQLKEILRQAALNTTGRERINLRIPQGELRQLRQKAAQEGIPYQTYIVGILRKFLNGGLVRHESLDRPFK